MYNKSKPRVSAITSCCDHNSAMIMERIFDRGAEYFDLYVFNQHDIAKFFGESSQLEHTEKLLAEMNEERATKENCNGLCTPPCSADCLAAKIAASQPGKDSKESRIVAFATNIPGISHTNAARRREAIEAILCCCRLAHSLDVCCVEIVGGLCFELAEAGKLNATAEMREERKKHLVESLNELDQRLQSEFGDSKSAVGLALEVEPGPPFLVNSLEIANEILNSPSLRHSEYIGLNVDVGHFLLLRDNDPESSISGPGVALTNQIEFIYKNFRRRIMHFHMSDHSEAHFCDLEIATYHSPVEFHRYVELFVRIRNSKSHNRFFTDAIAIEQEACRNADQVIRSVTLVKNWVRKCLAKDNADRSYVETAL